MMQESLLCFKTNLRIFKQLKAKNLKILMGVYKNLKNIFNIFKANIYKNKILNNFLNKTEIKIKIHIILNQELFTKVNGKESKDKAMDVNIGKIMLNILDFGITIWLVDKEYSPILILLFTKEIGKTIYPMDLAFM